MIHRPMFVTCLAGLLFVGGLSAADSSPRKGRAADAKQDVQIHRYGIAEDAWKTAAENSAQMAQSTGDQGEDPSVVRGALNERSAIRHHGETYEEAVLRHRNLLIRNHPDIPARYFDAGPTVVNSQVPVDQADLSMVPVWSNADITRYFEYSRDLRFQTTSSNPSFQRRLTWLYPDDGCFARAELVCSKSADSGLERPAKLFAFGDLYVKTANSPQGYVEWWYHVVPIVKSATTMECLVLDAAIDPSKPLPWKEWLLKQVASLNDVKVTVADTNAYMPDSLVFGESSQTALALSDQKSAYLPLEWDRQVDLRRDPNMVLGEAPPWFSQNLSITTHPSNKSIQANSSVSFRVAATGGTTPYRYQWYKNGTPISGAKSPSYTFKAQSSDNGATFKAYVTDSSSPAATVTSNSARLTVSGGGGPTTFKELESNDSDSNANAVPDTATMIVGIIDSKTDLDFFTVNVAAGATLTVNMTGPALDYDLYLYDSSGTMLMGSLNPNTASERVTWTNTGTSAVTTTLLVLGYANAYSTTTPYNLVLDRGAVNPPSTVTIKINPTTVAAKTGTTKQFTAKVSGSSNTDVIWTCTGGGTVNNGLYTAPSAACTATVKATSVADSTKSASATVTVTSTYSLTTAVNPPGSGTIKRNPNATSYASGTVVTLTATPASNYTFSRWSGNATGTSSTIQITMNGNKSVTASFRGSGSNCGTPPFNPEPWNDEGAVQENNNCYNYANNVRTDTFAQPGDYCGHMYEDITCAEVIAAAKCDGLVQTTKDAVLPPGMTRIALVVDNKMDFHWYRQDSNGMWSHKPGSTRARNTDESDQLISDPETCDRGDYTSFCLYFQICSGVEQFGGHSTIK